MTLTTRLTEALEAIPLGAFNRSTAIDAIRAELAKPLPEGEVERISRVICRSLGLNPDTVMNFDVWGHSFQWEGYISHAKAAYAAIVRVE